MLHINDHGWIIPGVNHKTYAKTNSTYYKCGIYSNDELINYNLIDSCFDIKCEPGKVLEKFSELKKSILGSSISNLLLAPHIPFILPRFKSANIGEILEREYFPALSVALEKERRSFKYVLRNSDDTLVDNLYPTEYYQNLMKAGQKTAIIGYYFPLALEGYAPSSQQDAFSCLFKDIPLSATLSGPIEIASVLVANSNLLFNQESYSHILTALASNIAIRGFS